MASTAMSAPSAASRARSRSGAPGDVAGPRSFQRTLSLKRVQEEMVGVSSPALEAGVIHQLPVKIIYDVLCPPTAHSAESTTSLLAYPTALQSAFVHLSEERVRKGEYGGGAGEQQVASLYLKGVVEGLCFASPELGVDVLTSPSASTPPDRHDYTIQVLDPRSSPSSPAWTGSGLLSWPLDEAGSGKTMIQGRVVRDETFRAASGGDGLDGLASLVRGREGDEAHGMGVEVHVRLRPILNPPPNPKAKQRAASASARLATSTDAPTSSTALLATPHALRQGSAPAIWSSPLPPGMLTPSYDPEALRLEVFGDGSVRRKGQGSAGKRKWAADSDALGDSMMPTSAFSECGGFDYSMPDYGETPSEAFDSKIDPTSDAAARTTSPAGVDAKPLAQVPHVYSGNTNKIRATGRQKRPKVPSTDGQGCANCGKAESSTWRQKEGMRVCNACGIYYNVHKSMRPQELWGRSKRTAAKRTEVAEKSAARAAAKAEKEAQTKAAQEARAVQAAAMAAQQAAPAETPAPPKSSAAQDLAVIRARKAEAFKRTMTKAVEQEAERVKARRLAQAKVGASKAQSTTDGKVASGTNRLPLAEMAPPSMARGQDQTPGNARAEPTPAFDMPDIDPAAMEALRNGTFTWTAHDQQQLDDDVDIGAWFKFSQSQQSQQSVVEPTTGADNGDDPFAIFDSLLPDGPSSEAFVNPAAAASTPFDFSQLPPSSPPLRMHELQHSHLLLSSPGTSPTGITPGSDKTTPDDAFPDILQFPTRSARTSFSMQTRPAGRHPLASVAAVAGNNSDESHPPSEEQFRAMMAEFEAGEQVIM